MYKIMMMAAALAFASGAALASDDDTMKGFYGNTVISTGGALEAHTHYNADHSFTMKLSAMGQTFDGKGTWALDGKGQVCRTFESVPAGMPNPSCSPIAAHKVGDTWTVDVAGTPRTLKLVAGIQ